MCVCTLIEEENDTIHIHMGTSMCSCVCMCDYTHWKQSKNKTIDRLLVSIQYQSSSRCDALRYKRYHMCALMHLALVFFRRKTTTTTMPMVPKRIFKSILIGIFMNSCLPENLIHTLFVGKSSVLYHKKSTRLGLSSLFLSVVHYHFCSVSCCFFSVILIHISCDKSPKRDHNQGLLFENTCYCIV